MTDAANVYHGVGREYAEHNTVNHSIEEYARGLVHTNTIEGFFSIFKRGMRGVYQHCSEQHLFRYLAEFDFRYSNPANGNRRSISSLVCCNVNNLRRTSRLFYFLKSNEFGTF
jgi:hypothetical protein